MKGALPAPVEPFFLRVDGGERFCLFHPAAGACRGALLYIHPFAEEMNRSRRTAALLARQLAAGGIGVLLIDLNGCGDSSGDFLDARWEDWKRDVGAASAWLLERTGQVPTLLGLRLGAALAIDHAHDAVQPPSGLLLWQPVVSGSAFLTQFLRLRVANDMLGGAETKAGVASLRSALAAGEALEVAGYELHPELAAAIDALTPARLMPRAPAHWFEVAGAPGRSVAPASLAIADGWRDRGVQLSMHQVVGPPFWSMQDSAASQELIDATCSVLLEAVHAG